MKSEEEGRVATGCRAVHVHLLSQQQPHPCQVAPGFPEVEGGELVLIDALLLITRDQALTVRLRVAEPATNSLLSLMGGRQD